MAQWHKHVTVNAIVVGSILILDLYYHNYKNSQKSTQIHINIHTACIMSIKIVSCSGLMDKVSSSKATACLAPSISSVVNCGLNVTSAKT